MKFEDVKEKMSIIHKLHTARDGDDKTIVYKKPYSAKKIIVKTNEIDSFDLDKVTYMSLSELGLLIQYKPVNTNKMYPFPIKNIEEIIVET